MGVTLSEVLCACFALGCCRYSYGLPNAVDGSIQMKKINWKDVLINCTPLWIYMAIVSYLRVGDWLYWVGFFGVAVLWLFGRAAFEVWRENRKGSHDND
jgi:hypothetical protein